MIIIHVNWFLSHETNYTHTCMPEKATERVETATHWGINVIESEHITHQLTNLNECFTWKTRLILIHTPDRDFQVSCRRNATIQNNRYGDGDTCNQQSTTTMISRIYLLSGTVNNVYICIPMLGTIVTKNTCGQEKSSIGLPFASYGNCCV